MCRSWQFVKFWKCGHNHVVTIPSINPTCPLPGKIERVFNFTEKCGKCSSKALMAAENFSVQTIEQAVPCKGYAGHVFALVTVEGHEKLVDRRREIEFLQGVRVVWHSLYRRDHPISLNEICNNLPTVAETEIPENQNTCAICLSSLVGEGNEPCRDAKKLACGHIFGLVCIQHVFESSSCALCPFCRSEVRLTDTSQEFYMISMHKVLFNDPYATAPVALEKKIGMVMLLFLAPIFIVVPQLMKTVSRPIHLPNREQWKIMLRDKFPYCVISFCLFYLADILILMLFEAGIDLKTFAILLIALIGVGLGEFILDKFKS